LSTFVSTTSYDTRAREERCLRILRAIDIIGTRWTGSILLAGARGARRFKEYRALVPGITDSQLTLRLKQLQERHLVERTVIPSTPVQITYTLTSEAKELIAILHPLAQWSERHLPPDEAQQPE
jgi:DNA-binding HxlR family transcriptional regulator